MTPARSYRDVVIPSATVTRIPNEAHLATVRDARRAADMWLTAGVPLTPNTGGNHAR